MHSFKAPSLVSVTTLSMPEVVGDDKILSVQSNYHFINIVHSALFNLREKFNLLQFISDGENQASLNAGKTVRMRITRRPHVRYPNRRVAALSVVQ